MAEPGEPDLRCRLGVPAKIAVGKPVPLRFALTNRGKQPIHVLIWNTPFEGFFGKFLQVTGPAGEVPYRGPMVKRGPPSGEDYLTIKPGATRGKSLNLAKAYDFTKPGSYQVRYVGPLHDATGGKVPRGIDALVEVALECAGVELVVEGVLTR